MMLPRQWQYLHRCRFEGYLHTPVRTLVRISTLCELASAWSAQSHPTGVATQRQLSSSVHALASVPVCVRLSASVRACALACACSVGMCEEKHHHSHAPVARSS